MTAQTHELPQLNHVSQGTTFQATAIVLEIMVGAWVLFLFMLALAWDPFDRWFGFRERRTVARGGVLASTLALAPAAEVADHLSRADSEYPDDPAPVLDTRTLSDDSDLAQE